jgi:hypothetical protein
MEEIMVEQYVCLERGRIQHIAVVITYLSDVTPR